jgi:putative transposase
VNAPATESETARLRLCVNRGQPYGEPGWVRRIARRLGLESTLRDPWRPKADKR